MATRKEVGQRRAALKEALHEGCRSGVFAPDAPVSPVRELSRKYQVSLKGVCETLQELVEEGALYTVPRVGTFVGRPRLGVLETYLFLRDPKSLQGRQVQMGFEERIAQRGGASLALDGAAASGDNDMPPPAGIFDFTSPFYQRHPDKNDTVPRVRFADWVEHSGQSDLVSFDNVDGGRQAARHLLLLGHTRIAYLALHTGKDGHRAYHWSAQREEGWQQALLQGGHSSAGLIFRPSVEPQPGGGGAGQRQVARGAALALLRRPDVTAVVAANDWAAVGLFDALRTADVPPSFWPAVVGFDDRPSTQQYVVTSLRLPWEEIGRVAADLLWERKHGPQKSPPQHRQVSMRLIPRLTCRPDWPSAAGSAAFAAAVPESV